MQKSNDVILCADSESLMHPELLGLDGEQIGSFPWLATLSDALEARATVARAQGSVEVWVAGSDQMEAINLAAALKRDRPDAVVRVVGFEASGSLASRAAAAGLGDVMDRAEFVGRFRTAKSRFSLFGEARPSESSPLNPAAGAQGPSALGNGGAGSGLSGAPGDPSFLAGRVQTPSAPISSSAHTQGVCDAGTKAPDAFAGIRPGPLMPSGMPLVQSLPSPDGSGSLSGDGIIPSGSPRTGGAWMLTVAGAGGGTGKSSVAALCACYAKRCGKRTLLLDADLQFGDLAYLMGDDSPLRCDDLLESPLRVEGLGSSEGVPALLAAPLRLERSEFVSARFKDLVELLRPRFDVIVVNTGASWSDVHMRLLEGSSNVLFLLDQRPSSIRACRHALELCASCGIASQGFLFAMNRCSRKALFSGADASSALQGVRVFELLDGGISVEEQLGCGNPMALFESGNVFAHSVEILMDEAMPRTREDDVPFVESKPRKRRWGRRRK
ncbi:MAG: CpaE family protein [Eggerthellaceae bacterium]